MWFLHDVHEAIWLILASIWSAWLVVLLVHGRWMEAAVTAVAIGLCAVMQWRRMREAQ
jgi:hypothetical protein